MGIFKAGDKVRIINAVGQPDKLMVIPDIEHVGKVGVITASFHYQHGNIESDYDIALDGVTYRSAHKHTAAAERFLEKVA
ncbi:hypothetical protein pf16_224 [Pseudomonas phage pf16]|uniref:Uncharacterized protein n=1 Tax=Pseudomonas phage pf16 TaxID=1815630 RepID=A0A1S5R406_9CAUD|nr:hypothetical protein FDG98_gp074 [Pseudomonas phage pf16]AND75147.1 hypothetical protein pf16_224 [Pseudomonas phage pf16]